METVPLWMHSHLAETLAHDGAVPDPARVHCPYWVGRAHAAAVCSEEELFQAAARIGAVALLAQPLQPHDAGELDARRNQAYAASLASWTLVANGYELRPTRMLDAMAEAERQLRQGFLAVAEAARVLAARMLSLGPVPVEPFRFEPDPPELALPIPPVVYLASALTGFRDVAPEWLWSRNVLDAAPAVIRSNGTWSDPRSARSEMALSWQRATNARVAALLRDAGLEVFVPHEQFDPDLHTDKTPESVDLGDRLGVAKTDVIVLLGDYPATGAGKELVLAESGLEVTVMVASPDARTSRLISGTRHASREVVDDWSTWPCGVLDAILADLAVHERHARVREENRQAAETLMSLLPADAQDDGSLLTLERARQLRDNASLVPSASLLELQELLRLFGFRLVLSVEPVSEQHPQPAEALDLVAIVGDFLDRADGVGRHQPNSAEVLRRAMGIRAPTVDDGLKSAALTSRDENGQFLIRIKGGSPRRQRFSIAHELAHVLLEGESLTVSHRHGREPDRDREQQVDQVAAAMLLPTEWITAERRRLRASGVAEGSVDELSQLARPIAVTMDVVAMRLTALDPERPIVLVEVRHEDGIWATVRVAGLPPGWYVSGMTQGNQLRLTGLPAPGALARDVEVELEASLAAKGTMSCRASVRRIGEQTALAVVSHFKNSELG